ncbi:MAG: thioredoxin family protein [Actinomycetota bacterium]|jgi:thiol-disulfide isomerase/thioredoxin
MSGIVARFLVLAGVGVLVALIIVFARRYFRTAPIPSTFDDAANTAGNALIEFVTPYCYECKEALPMLEAASNAYQTPLEIIDARERPELAVKYSIRHTPTILVVDRRGSVRAGWLGIPPKEELDAALAAVSSA